MKKHSPGIRAKLIGIFVLIKVLPLVVLAWFAWNAIFTLAVSVEKSTDAMVANTRNVVKGVSDLSTERSIQALDNKSREAIERLTTDTARKVAAFLYDRDRDIELAARLSPEANRYRDFLKTRFRPVILHEKWIQNEEGTGWTLATPENQTESSPTVTAQNDDNRRDFHYRFPEKSGKVEPRPLFLEMTFIDLRGNEKIKVTTSDLMPKDLKNVSDPKNTYCRAERYFTEIQRLAPDQIYVSEVIGPYVKGRMIGTYTRKRAEKMGFPFTPENSGYAGKENPVGRRFQGLVRWCMPVVRDGRKTGYVTLALDHTHIMEFTDHIIPTEERYSPISDASTGNYAFMWDYKGRNISHPRDYFIVGFDPQTGQRAVPWLDEEMYAVWKQCDESMPLFEKTAPTFKEQALSKKPAADLTRKGLLGLDGRYLNFAPQCSGWHNLTQYGGSGSFLIFWSGLWKLTTAGTIPYYTGIYGNHPRGFGYVTIGANVHEFHRPAVETAKDIEGIEKQFEADLLQRKKENQQLMRSTIQKTAGDLTLYTIIMVAAVIFIAVLMAAALTGKITDMIRGIRQFQGGDLGHRLSVKSKDEMGQLTHAFNEMADNVQRYIGEMQASQKELENVNMRLQEEIREKQQAEEELSRHRDNLEEMVRGRTQELEAEIQERKRVEEKQAETEKRLKQQNKTLLGLARNEQKFRVGLEDSLRMISQAAAWTMQVERTSVWMFEKNRSILSCKILYELSQDRHSSGYELVVGEYPAYFDALRSGRTIAAEDAQADPRTREMAHDYLSSLGITSMLDANIMENGEMVGVVCFEHTGEKRQWHLDEENFANSIADLITSAIGAEKRLQSEKMQKQLEARLHRAEKMEAIGTLAGGVAHDLNNILSGIVSYPELLLLKMQEDNPFRKPVETILKSGRRAAAIVQDLLTLARRGVAITEVVDLNQIILEYLESPEYYKLISFHPGIKVHKTLAANLQSIAGSSVHLSKTLMNLVSNAAEAMPDGGTLTISTSNHYIDRPVKGYDEVEEGEYVLLTVSDTGQGIAPEDMARIFEPFYTKKKMGRSGTGLGMALVWGTVKDHRGYIDFDTNPQTGTTFSLYFPITRKVSRKKKDLSIEEYAGSGQRILVVDDVSEQLEIASAILTELNYQVDTVKSGEEAVAFLKEQKVDLLVLDMIMDPGMDGLDTYKKAVELHPGQKAIVASGFSETERIREALRIGVGQYLKKPYTIQNIGMAVKTELEK